MTRTDRTCYVGVDLNTEEVVLISWYSDRIVDAYALTGEHSGLNDGVIYLNDDGTFNGRKALKIALAETQPIGLGWTFRPRLSAAWSA